MSVLFFGIGVNRQDAVDRYFELKAAIHDLQPRTPLIHLKPFMPRAEE
jgi:hypothetical protein